MPGIHFRLREPSVTDVAEIEATAVAANSLPIVIERANSLGADNPAARER
jgi:hypothetical protein